MKNSRTRKVAIVGGGIAGLYCAWRLKETRPQFAVTLFESSSEVGGRLLSVEIPGLGFPVELGAMRFKPGHKCLQSLLEALDLQKTVRPFAIRDLYHLRGRLFTGDEITDGKCGWCNGGIPFRLKEEELDKGPTELIIWAIVSLLEALGPYELKKILRRDILKLKKCASEDPHKIIFCLSDFLEKHWKQIRDQAEYQGHSISDFGFWNVMQHSLSNEAVQLIHGMLSLESILGNWNAAEAIPWIVRDFNGTEFQMLPSGLQSLATTLSARLGSIIQCETPVSKLQFNGTRKRRYWDVYSGSGNELPRSYDDVILALPQKPLKELTIISNPRKSERWHPEWLDWVQARHMLKLFLLYESCWWEHLTERFRPMLREGETLGEVAVRIFTDLPVRQVYLFPPKWMGSHGTADHTRQFGLIMASYSDEQFADFWSVPLRSKPMNVVWDKDLKGPKWDIFKNKYENNLVGDRVVEKVNSQLKEILGLQKCDFKPLCGVYKDWEEAGAWHTWKAGHQPWKEGSIYNPLKNLYLCGEAFSTEQGWIEGALRTAEQILRMKPFSVPQPEKGLLSGLTPEEFDEYIKSS